MRNGKLMVGAFYNPHLGAQLAQAEGIDHLAMADPPAAADPWWPAIRQRYTLLLHDYLGQLSEPLDERSITRGRALAELYGSRCVAWRFQSPLRVPAPVHRGLPRPLRPESRCAPGAARPAAGHGEHSGILRRPGESDARAGVAAALLRGDRGRLPARSPARVAAGALPREEARALARRIPPRVRGGAARRRCGRRRRSRRAMDRARPTDRRDARLPGARGRALPPG